MSTTTAPVTRRGFGVTSRKDNWWITPLLTFLGLSSFIVYSTWAAFQAADYFSNAGGADYLSPFYSPVLWDAPGQESGHALFGPKPSWWPGFLPFSPAFLILWAPAGFRLTCYYYRGAYLDCVRAVDYLSSREDVDQDRIAIWGGSQGGGLAFATASLDPRIDLCVADIPWLCDWENYLTLAGKTDDEEIQTW